MYFSSKYLAFSLYFYPRNNFIISEKWYSSLTLNNSKYCACVLSCVWPFAAPGTVCSPPGSSVCGIFQAKLLQWIAISLSKGSFQPRDETQRSNPCRLHCQADSLPLIHLGNPTGNHNNTMQPNWLVQNYYTL